LALAVKNIQQLLPDVYRDVVSDPLAEEDLVLTYWPSTVGPMIAYRTRPVGVFGRKLFVEVTDPAWRDELQSLSRRIARQLNKAVGRKVLWDVSFRLGRARGKPPARAASAEPLTAPSSDEADDIRDPHLRRIFRARRSKSGAGKTA
jgi:predicted nucleic acid-binding Zn ribbon protein